MLDVNSINIKGEEIECSSINIIIGPNNSGKSTLLEEIYNTSHSLQITSSDNKKWLEGVKLTRRKSLDNLKDMMPNVFSGPYRGKSNISDTGFSGYKSNINNDFYNERMHEELNSLTNEEVEYSASTEEHFPRNNTDRMNQLISQLVISYENTKGRLDGKHETNVDSISKTPPSDIIHFLLTRPDILKKINNHIKKVFGIELCFDNLQQGKKPLRIKPEVRISGATNLPSTSMEWDSKSPLVASQGDGLKAYLKLMLCLFEPHNDIVFIDEPETFLHPPHRRELGVLIAKLATTYNKQVFIASHDSEFLGGLISSGELDTRVLYLTRVKGSSNCAHYKLKDISNLTNRDSQFVTERLLQSFFYQKTVLCEDESDRTFYEIAATEYFHSSVQNINFVGLEGIPSMISIYKKLDNLGLRCGIIFDFDFLIDRDCPFDPQVKSHNQFRSSVQSTISRSLLKKSDLKEQGLRLLQGNPDYKDLLDMANQAIEDYKKREIYIVPNGELESFTGGTRNIGIAINYIRERRRRTLSKFLKEVIAI